VARWSPESVVDRPAEWCASTGSSSVAGVAAKGVGDAAAGEQCLGVGRVAVGEAPDPAGAGGDGAAYMIHPLVLLFRAS